MRLNYVPLHSIIVTRRHPQSTTDRPLPDRQVDALDEYKTTGKAFKFTEDEVNDIKAAFDGDLARALREPSDELDVEAAQVEIPASSSTQAKTPANKDIGKAASKDADL